MDTTFIVSWDMILSQKQSRQSHEEVQLQSTIQKKVYSLHHEPIFTIGVILRMDLWDLNISKLLLSLICSLSSFVLLCFWNDTGFFFHSQLHNYENIHIFFVFLLLCYWKRLIFYNCRLQIFKYLILEYDKNKAKFWLAHFK